MPQPDNAYCEVAVVIPTYNCASSLPAAIESALAQTYRDFRIYVIDDGSTDATTDVLRQYADRCVCLWQPNAGAAAARNRGIRESSSRYVAFLDADDLWHPTKLEQQLEVFNQRPDVGMVISSFAMVMQDGHTGLPITRNYICPELGDGGVFALLVTECFVATPCAVVRREVLEEVGVFNEALAVCEDVNMWLRIASCWKMAALREVLVTVYKRVGSLSMVAGGTKIALAGKLAALQHVEASCEDLSQSEQRTLQRSLAVYYYKSGSARLTAGERESAREHLGIAIRYRPFYGLALVKFGGSLMPLSMFRFFAGIYHLGRR